MEPRRLAGKFLNFLHFAGDIYGAAMELTDPNEPNLGQRIKNAGLVTTGELGASVATGGLDFIPDLAEFATAMGFEAPAGPLRKFQKSAPLFNPEHYLRLASYGFKHEPTEARLRDAAEEFRKPYEDQSLGARITRQGPALGGLMMPMR